MPANNNGNSKTDAIRMVDTLNIEKDTTPRTFMDCVKITTTAYVEMKKEHFLLLVGFLEQGGVSECKKLGDMFATYKDVIATSRYADCSEGTIQEIINTRKGNAWGRQYPRNLLGFHTFQKWCLMIDEDGVFENQLHENSSYTTNRFKIFTKAMKCIVDVSIGMGAKKEKECVDKIATLKKSNELFVEEINTLTKIIEDNNIEMNMCELCNKQLDEKDMTEDGKPFTKCGANMCLLYPKNRTYKELHSY